MACNNKPIGGSLSNIRRHMKEFHPLLFCAITKFSKFHSSIIAATNNNLKLTQPCLPVDSAGPIVVRLKCLYCNRSFGMQQNYDRHVRESNGHCNGGIPIRTKFKVLDSSRFVEVTAATNPPSASPLSSHATSDSIVHGFTQVLLFKTVELKILKYVLDIEDSDTFISLFTPLLQDNVVFLSQQCASKLIGTRIRRQ